MIRVCLKLVLLVAVLIIALLLGITALIPVPLTEEISEPLEW